MRITEGQLRSLIREAISKNVISHSQGWIDPEGGYHYDHKMPDHGKWAARTLLELGMSEALLDGVRAMVDRYIGLGYEELKGVDTTDAAALGQREISWIVEDVAKDLLLGMGWGRVMNAYTIDVSMPTPIIIDRWLELGMDAGVDPDGTFVVRNSGKVLESGDMTDIERYTRALRR